MARAIEQADSLQEARIKIADTPWRNEKEYAKVVYAEMVMSEMFGRLEVAMRDMGLTLSEFKFINLPFAEAITFFKSKGIFKGDWSKLSDAYRSRSFYVSKLHHEYLVEQMRSSIDRAISSGLTKRDFIKQMGEAFDNAGVTRLKKHYLETVFDTNVLGSYQHGRYQQQRDPDIMEDRPYWQYRTVGDGRVRPTHEEMDGRVYRNDHPIWSTWYPPNGFRCRCSVDTLTPEEGKSAALEDMPDVKPDKGFATSPEDFLSPQK